jgi:DAK2 domain fusion protein YloV
VATAVETLDGRVLRDVMARFSHALGQHRDELNSLNVYPVPDGDTGTNMHLTQRSVVDAIGRVDPEAPVAELGRVVAEGALMGARGNSGVILAQVLRGLWERLGEGGGASPALLADALTRAAEEAYRAVARPMEGTVLTVLSDAAAAARDAARPGADLGAVAEAALAASEASLERTREVLPELRAAGVVDAGAKGIVLLFDAMAAVLGGHGMTVAVGPPGPIGHVEGGDRGQLSFRYEVMYLLEGGDDGVPALNERLGELGDSLVVVGGGGMFKVHVHTNEPDRAVEAGRDSGTVRDVQVVDLGEQVAEHCVAGQARAVRVAEHQATALVAVADGDGLARIFRSLGAVVVPGGPGRNPSVGDLVEAIRAAPASSVVVLPNHRNVVPAAEQAAGASAKDTRVVPTRSVPAGLASAAAFNPMATLEENEKDMGSAAGATTAIEITRAARDAQTLKGSVRAGQWIGLADGEVLAVGGEPAGLAARLVGELRSEDHEVLTLVVGADPSEEEAAAVEESVRRAAADLHVEVHRGGQPHYAYLVGLE